MSLVAGKREKLYVRQCIVPYFDWLGKESRAMLTMSTIGGHVTDHEAEEHLDAFTQQNFGKRLTTPEKAAILENSVFSVQ